VGRAEAGPAAELGLGGEGEGRLLHHRSRGLDLHQAPGYGGGDDVPGVPGELGHGGTRRHFEVQSLRWSNIYISKVTSVISAKREYSGNLPKSSGDIVFITFIRS
jgi:hypothetical protein